MADNDQDIEAQLREAAEAQREESARLAQAIADAAKRDGGA